MSEVICPEKKFKKKLNCFFRKLRRLGYFAKQNFGYYADDGFTKIPKNVTKIVFYSKVQAKNIPYGYVHIVWSGNPKEIIISAKQCGLSVDWNGNENKSMKIYDKELYIHKDDLWW